MQDLQALIEYISASRPLIVVGSGPSCEIGLPSWEGLADRLISELRLTPRLNIEPAEEAFARRDFAAVFGIAARVAGEPRVYGVCAQALKDNNRPGGQYQLITKIPARGYITTNFESILRRHFTDRGIATVELLNTPEDLASVDFDTARTILKIHGDFSRPDFLVLTDRQYRQIMHDGRFLTLREFIKSYLQTSRMLFLGYSLNDPDFSFLLEATAQTLRRKVPLFAIIANASEFDIARWFERYNLHAITYRASDHNHSDLNNILETISAYFTALPPGAATVPFAAAQSLYMWHKMQSTEGTEAKVDVLRAILLGTIASASQGQTISDLVVSISNITGRPPSDALRTAIGKALSALGTEQLIKTGDGTHYSVTDGGKTTENRYSRQFNNLRTLFEAQVQLDLKKRLPNATHEYITKLGEKVHSCVLKIFSDRGGELVDASFAENFEAPSSMNLVRIINSFSADLEDSQRYAFFSYLMNLVTRPREEQKLYLDYLAKAFFAAQVIGVDPEGQAFRREVLRARTLIVDANILIPLLAYGSAGQPYMQECLQTFQSAGIKLITTPRYFEEASAHFQWAAEHVRRFGPQSIEVLSAALGSPEFRRNEGIDGFIRVAVDKNYDIDDYMQECFGGIPNFYNIRDTCAQLKISQVSLNDLASTHQDLWVVQTEVEDYIKNLQAESETPKSDPRIKAEADAYAICYGWKYRLEKGTDPMLWRCSILSRGTSLNRVARLGPYPLGNPVVVRPDLLHEAIRDFVGGEQKANVGDMMLASYVRSVDYFIDKSKYSQFFRPLIREAEKIYKDNLDRFQSVLEGPIDAADLEQYDELERPFVVDSLQQDVVASVDQQVDKLTHELESVKGEVRKNEEIAKLAMSYLSPSLRKRIERITNQ